MLLISKVGISELQRKGFPDVSQEVGYRAEAVERQRRDLANYINDGRLTSASPWAMAGLLVGGDEARWCAREGWDGLGPRHKPTLLRTGRCFLIADGQRSDLLDPSSLRSARLGSGRGA